MERFQAEVVDVSRGEWFCLLLAEPDGLEGYLRALRIARKAGEPDWGYERRQGT